MPYHGETGPAGSKEGLPAGALVQEGALQASEAQAVYIACLHRSAGKEERPPYSLEEGDPHFISARPDGWLPPSIQSKADIYLSIIGRYMQALLVGTGLRIEAARFDIARIKEPSVRRALLSEKCPCMSTRTSGPIYSAGTATGAGLAGPRQAASGLKTPW